MSYACMRIALMRWLIVLALVGCRSSSSESSNGKKKLSPEHAALVKGFSDRVATVLATEPVDPETLPRCPKADDALLLDRQSIAYHVGAKPQPLKFVGSPVMQLQVGCGSYWDDSFRSWIEEGKMNEFLLAELEHAKTKGVSFCYWREEIPSVFEGCGAPDPSTRVMRCSRQKIGKSVIDVVRHNDGAQCANRVTVDHPPYDDDGGVRARALSTFLSRYFSARDLSKKDPCNYLEARRPYRISVDGEVVCEPM